MATAYIWSAVVFIIFFLVVILIANMVPYKPNNTGRITRRIWFWVFSVITFAVAFLINLAVAGGIAIQSQKDEYINNSIIGACAAFVLYVVLGLVISKIFPKTKVGTWFN